MTNSLALLGIFSGVAVATSLFLASFFFFKKNKDQFKNNLLGLLFVAVGLRIAKSIVYFIFFDVVSIGLAIGYIALSSIGPILFLNIRALNNNESKLFIKDIFHFIIPVLGTVICLFVSLDIVTVFYKSATALLLVYIIVSYRNHLTNTYDNLNIKQWNNRILLSIGIVWAAFVYQHLAHAMIQYAIGACIASAAMYYIFIYALKDPLSFNQKPKVTLPNKVVKLVKEAFEEDKFYLEHSITLTKFAHEKNIPSYLISESVKKLYNKSFPESVNSFRINDLKYQLINNGGSFFKIESLAYEHGFSTPSTFYAAFKRETRMSPKEFQKKHLL